MDRPELNSWWDEERQRALADLLLREWDPIGVNTGDPEDWPTIQGEYTPEVPFIADRLDAGASIEQLTALLGRLRRDYIGLWAVPEADRAVAQRIASWYEAERTS
jgi:hypothetical protein